MDTQIKLAKNTNTMFTLVYETYNKKMYAYGIAIGFCQYMCNDAVHDVFITLFNSKKILEEIENLETYLMQCMKNRLFDIYKDQKRRCCIDYDDNTNSCEDYFLDKIIAEENRQLMEKEVDRLLKKIPSRHRKIILCRFNYDLKYNEIAIIMNMTPDAVKKQLYRSLKLMEHNAESDSKSHYNTV